MDYLGGPSVVRSVLLIERQEGQSLEDAVLL